MLDPATERHQRVRNLLHEVLLVGCLLALYAGLAWMLFGLGGLVWSLVAGGWSPSCGRRSPPGRC